MDRERLEALRRQVEEDYRLDMAAIERIERRYLSEANSAPAPTHANGVQINNYVSPSKWSEEAEPIRDPRSLDPRNADPRVDPHLDPPTPPLSPSSRAERRNDELVGSIRSMFSSGRL